MIQKIYEKLREINIIVNNSAQVKRKIKFIYAIKDDMFCKDEKKSRTKFFDFIIPVVPIVNAFNSSEILWRKFFKHK